MLNTLLTLLFTVAAAKGFLPAESAPSFPDPASPSAEAAPIRSSAPALRGVTDSPVQDPSAQQELVFDPYQISHEEQEELKALIERTDSSGRIVPRPGIAETSEMLQERRDRLWAQCMVTPEKREHDRQDRANSAFGVRTAVEFPTTSQVLASVYSRSIVGVTGDGLQAVFRPVTGKTYIVQKERDTIPYRPDHVSLQGHLIHAQEKVVAVLDEIGLSAYYKELGLNPDFYEETEDTNVFFLERNHLALERSLKGRMYEGFPTDLSFDWRRSRQIADLKKPESANLKELVEQRRILMAVLSNSNISGPRNPGARLRRLDIALFEAMKERDALFRQLPVVDSDAGAVARYLGTEVIQPWQATVRELSEVSKDVYVAIAARDQVRDQIKNNGETSLEAMEALLQAQNAMIKTLKGIAADRDILQETIDALSMNNAAVQSIYEGYTKHHPGAPEDLTSVLAETEGGRRLLEERVRLLNQLTGRRNLVVRAKSGKYYRLASKTQNLIVKYARRLDVKPLSTADRDSLITKPPNSLVPKPRRFSLLFP